MPSFQSFPAGTLALFQQTIAPLGWVKQTTHDDKGLRVVSGAASSGGSVAFSTVFGKTATDATTITTATMASHVHTLQTVGSNTTGASNFLKTSNVNSTQNVTSAGSDGSHTHPIDIRMQYVDLIIAMKS